MSTDTIERKGARNKAQMTGVAEQEEVKIVGRGTLAGTGWPFLLVTSLSEPGRVHCVSYLYEGAYVGARIQCDCTGYHYRGHCKHTALAVVWLAEQMERAPLVASGGAQSQLNRSKSFSLLK